MVTSPNARPPLLPLPPGRFVARACVAPPDASSPQRTCCLSYLAVALFQKRTSINHATPPRGAKSPAKKAPRCALSLPVTPVRALPSTHNVSLLATVSRIAATGTFAPFATGCNVKVRPMPPLHHALESLLFLTHGPWRRFH